MLHSFDSTCSDEFDASGAIDRDGSSLTCPSARKNATALSNGGVMFRDAGRGHVFDSLSQYRMTSRGPER